MGDSFRSFEEAVRVRLKSCQEQKAVLLKNRSEFNDEMARKRQRLIHDLSSVFSGKDTPGDTEAEVKLLIGGENFTASIKTLTNIPNTLFTLLLQNDSGGQMYQLDRDPDLFRVVLQYMEDPVNFSGLSGICKLDATNIAREAGFYGLGGLRRLAINCTSLVVSKERDSPYSTISAAVAAAANGDRIVVLPGVYEEVVFTTKRLEICGEGNREDVVVCTKEVHPTIVFTGSGGGVLRNLTLREDSPFGVGLVEGKGSSSIMIESCDLSTKCSGNAINIVDASSLHLVDCVVHDVKGSGVFLRDTATATIRNNVFYNLDSCGLFTRHQTRFYLENNKIHKAALGGLDINDMSLGTIEGNMITHCGRGGIVFYGSSHTRVKGNTITHNEYGMRSFESSIQIINHNIVRDNIIEDHQGSAIKRAIQEEDLLAKKMMGPVA
eukprot:TRINITY_DN1403_c3_g1_i1.p1 TRINITY_DN1403_c3_g1~~TRINITY_DN1403_c3_g1_i1.p1  ORF type:complete len:473 (+),score=180.38 TRINITY_DN1403_c3_g1_i1:109-1419(+)